MLREGGNAVDAAVCAVLTSFVTESPLTGLGAGGFMLIHDPARTGPDRDVLVDFFVAAGGADGAERGAELVPIPVDFGDQTQVFNVGAASCGVPGTPAGLERVARTHRIRGGRGAGEAGGPDRPRGGRDQPAAGIPVRDPDPDPDRDAGGQGAVRAAGSDLGRGRDLSLPRAGGGAGTLRRGRRRAFLHRRGGPQGGGVGARARRDARTRRPRGVRVDRAGAGGRALSRRRRAHQSAAVLRRDPARLCARRAGAARRDHWSRAAGRRDGGSERTADG